MGGSGKGWEEVRYVDVGERKSEGVEKRGKMGR